MRRDPVTSEVAQHVLARDGGCVGPRIGMPDRCFGRPELDHIHTGGGIQLRGPSIPTNLVSLCRVHHRIKTDHGSTWRPPLDDYVRNAEARLRLRT